VGMPAYVFPVDHPSDLVSNTTWSLTSPVVRIGLDGEFETEHTVYVPADKDDSIVRCRVCDQGKRKVRFCPICNRLTKHANG
jgi:hypothetical protein